MNSDHRGNSRNYAATYNIIHRKKNILCLGQNDIDKYDSNVHAQCN